MTEVSMAAGVSVRVAETVIVSSNLHNVQCFARMHETERMVIVLVRRGWIECKTGVRTGSSLPFCLGNPTEYPFLARCWLKKRLFTAANRTHGETSFRVVGIIWSAVA